MSKLQRAYRDEGDIKTSIQVGVVPLTNLEFSSGAVNDLSVLFGGEELRERSFNQIWVHLLGQGGEELETCFLLVR